MIHIINQIKTGFTNILLMNALDENAITFVKNTIDKNKDNKITYRELQQKVEELKKTNKDSVDTIKKIMNNVFEELRIGEKLDISIDDIMNGGIFNLISNIYSEKDLGIDLGVDKENFLKLFEKQYREKESLNEAQNSDKKNKKNRIVEDTITDKTQYAGDIFGANSLVYNNNISNVDDNKSTVSDSNLDDKKRQLDSDLAKVTEGLLNGEPTSVNLIKKFDSVKDSMDSNKVKALQKALNMFIDGDENKLKVNGKFDKKTKENFDKIHKQIILDEKSEQEDSVKKAPEKKSVETYPKPDKPFTEYIGPNSRGEKVSRLQKFLGLKATGKMNTETTAVVMAVQAANNKGVDGKIGRNTRELLNSGKAKKPQSFPHFNEKNSKIPTTRLNSAFNAFAKAKAEYFRSFEKYATPKEINGRPGSKKLQADIAEYLKTAKGNEKDLYERMIKLISPIFENKKILNGLKSYINRNVPSIRVILLTEFINASMHGLGDENTNLQKRIAREKNSPKRLEMFKRDFDPILAGTKYDIKQLEEKYYKINTKDSKESKYYKDTITLVGRPEGKGGAVAGTKELEGKTVRMDLDPKIVAELLSPAFNFEYFQNIFEDAGLGSPTRNEILVAIMTGKYKGRVIKADLFFGKAANCLNDLIGLKISVPKPRRHVRHKAHPKHKAHRRTHIRKHHKKYGKNVTPATSPVAPIVDEQPYDVPEHLSPCDPRNILSILNTHCGSQDGIGEGDGDSGGGIGGDSSSTGTDGGGSNGGGGNGGGNSGGR